MKLRSPQSSVATFLTGLALAAAPAIHSAEINSALTHTQELISSSNLTAVEPEDYEVKLNLARRQRDEHDFEQASKTLVSILDYPAPEEYHRTALLELALTAQQQDQPAKAQQVFSQYVKRYPDDVSVPEVLLRQGLLYRQVGATEMALSKFYAVMTTILNLKLDGTGYYQRLVLQAQTEIADTYYFQGKYGDAAEFFARLMKLDSADLNKTEIHLKLVRCLSLLGRHGEVVTEARVLLTGKLAAANEAELRFLLASALKQLGRNADSLKQVLLLLESTEGNQYWKQRAGNEIGNQLYNEGDYLNALTVYTHLADIDSSPSWQLPVHYQIGLVYERLQQLDKATETYNHILEQTAALSDKADPQLKTVLDMAAWRKNYLAWQTQADQANQNANPPTALPPVKVQ